MRWYTRLSDSFLGAFLEFQIYRFKRHWGAFSLAWERVIQGHSFSFSVGFGFVPDGDITQSSVVHWQVHEPFYLLAWTLHFLPTNYFQDCWFSFQDFPLSEYARRDKIQGLACEFPRITQFYTVFFAIFLSLPAVQSFQFLAIHFQLAVL